MEIEFTKDARKDLEKLNSRQLSVVKQKISELENAPTGGEDSKLIRIAGREIYRLKIKETRGGEIDYRVIYDVEDKVTIYSIFHRDEGYDDKPIE